MPSPVPFRTLFHRRHAANFSNSKFTKSNQMATIASTAPPSTHPLISLLETCKSMDQLQQIHCRAIKTGIHTNPLLQNRVITFCCTHGHGDLQYAYNLFEEIPEPNVFIWNTMIRGYSRLDSPQLGVSLYLEMLRRDVKPDRYTFPFIGVLSACTHTGMVDKGREYFLSMTTQHGIGPNIAHYGCLVDLLARAGRLKEAQEVVENMPMKPNSIVWGALLAGCRVHREADMAEMVAKQILELEPENGAVYVLLCNIYAACKRWNDLRELRQIMMDKGIKKTPGCSLIEMNGLVHEFVAGDRSHPQTKEIDVKLDKMTHDLKFAGYSPDISEVFVDIAEEDKENSVFRHSEKLAIAFGLINSQPGVTIRIVKNLRMCMDCHNMAKLVSKVYDREVIVRDRTRFHHFNHGLCSCKDYW